MCCCIYMVRWMERGDFLLVFSVFGLGYYFLSIPSKLIIQRKETVGLVKDRKVTRLLLWIGNSRRWIIGFRNWIRSDLILFLSPAGKISITITFHQSYDNNNVLVHRLESTYIRWYRFDIYISVSIGSSTALHSIPFHSPCLPTSSQNPS